MSELTPADKRTQVKKSPPLGFGFDADQTEHCFIVTMPISKAKDAKVLISEHFHWLKPEKAKKPHPPSTMSMPN